VIVSLVVMSASLLPNPNSCSLAQSAEAMLKADGHGGTIVDRGSGVSHAILTQLRTHEPVMGGDGLEPPTSCV
jgi:hypothetical protein